MKHKKGILCVTNRKLCREDFTARLMAIAKAGAERIILREKDLSENEYERLAGEVMQICNTFQTPCSLHTYADAAVRLGVEGLHLPMPVLKEMEKTNIQRFRMLGASCHSVAEAVEAERLGCTYITAGHIFDTDCKKGVPGRGLSFLREVCETVRIPVYAIGGVTHENFPEVKRAGAAGACVMSGLMTCGNVEDYIDKFFR